MEPAATTELHNVGLSVVIPLTRSSAPPPDGNRVRRGLLAGLREVDPELPELLHADPGSGGHPWTISAAFFALGRWWMRVTGVGARICASLGSALRPGRLASSGGWALAPETTWRARAVRLSDLSPSQDGAGGGRRWVVSLLSASLFSDLDSRETTPVPTSWTLVGGWWRRWIAHLGLEALPASLPACPGDFKQWCEDRIVIHTDALVTQPVRTSRGFSAAGSIGTLVADVYGDASELAGMSALLRFGTFAGAGRKLAFGFGQTAVANAPVDLPGLVRAHRPLSDLTRSRPHTEAA